MTNRWLTVGLLGGLLVAAALSLGAVAFAQGGSPEIHQVISSYEGSSTCGMCHPDQARDVAASLHYQQRAVSTNVEGEQGVVHGMMEDY